MLKGFGALVFHRLIIILIINLFFASYFKGTAFYFLAFQDIHKIINTIKLKLIKLKIKSLKKIKTKTYPLGKSSP